MPPAASNKLLAGSKRKYLLALADGHELDLSRIDPNSNVSPAVIAALKQRIIQLEDELATHREPPTKRARKTPAVVEEKPFEPSGSRGINSTTSATKADEKKRKLQLKKFFDSGLTDVGPERLKKECKSDGCKFQGGPKTIKIDEVISVEDFNAIFRPGEIGRLVQPTPENKPTSTVTIIEFNSIAAIRELFDNELKELKGNQWTRGGGPAFSKSVKLGQVDVEPTHLDVQYAKNGMKLTLKFEVDEIGRDKYNYGDEPFFAAHNMWVRF